MVATFASRNSGARPGQAITKSQPSTGGHATDMTPLTKAPRLTTDEELLGMRLAHRVIVHDLARLSRLADEMVADRSRFDHARCAAISGYVSLFAASLHHHHNVEDFSLWPLITESAGPHVDFTELTDDHDEIDPLLDDLVRSAGALPQKTAIAEFAQTVRRLRAMLDEHIADEERTVFPLITGYVSAESWQTFEKGAQRGARMDFDLTRVFAVMTPEEAERARKELPFFLRALVSVLARKQRRRERAVFGAAV